MYSEIISFWLKLSYSVIFLCHNNLGGIDTAKKCSFQVIFDLYRIKGTGVVLYLKENITLDAIKIFFLP